MFRPCWTLYNWLLMKYRASVKVIFLYYFIFPQDTPQGKQSRRQHTGTEDNIRTSSFNSKFSTDQGDLLCLDHVGHCIIGY